MAVEGKTVENYNKNGDLPIIQHRMKNHLSYILWNSIPEDQPYSKA